MKVPLSISIEEEQRAMVRALARSQGKTTSYIVRKAIRAYLKVNGCEPEPIAPDPRQLKIPGSDPP
jgi:predicted DNA-binding protein